MLCAFSNSAHARCASQYPFAVVSTFRMPVVLPADGTNKWEDELLPSLELRGAMPYHSTPLGRFDGRQMESLWILPIPRAAKGGRRPLASSDESFLIQE